MSEYIRCSSCNFPLGDVRRLYKACLEIKLGKTSENRHFDSSTNTTAADILDILNVKNICCRTRMLTAITIEEEIKKR